MSSRKVEKAKESFKREISSIILSMDNPEIQREVISVSSVELSKDCLFCKSYISCVNGISQSKKLCKILNKASGYISSILASRLKTRLSPKLIFIPNDSEEYAFKMNSIFSRMRINNKSNLIEISNFLKENDDFAIYTHVNPDGDAFGSCLALYFALKQIGKRVKFIYDNEFNKKLQFVLDLIEENDNFLEKNLICLDVSDTNTKRIGKYENQKFQICIDHHDVDECNFAKMFYVDKKVSSCAEIIYGLLNIMNVYIDKKIATCIYIGISSDTGRFKFSNVSEKTFDIISEIFHKIDNYSDINYKLSGQFSKNFIKFQSYVMDNFEYFGDCCFSLISMNIMNKFDVKYPELDSIYQIPLQISGINVSVIAKQVSDNVFRVSVRSFNNGKALRFCKLFGGGGHPDAAGFEINGNEEEVRSRILENIDSLH